MNLNTQKKVILFSIGLVLFFVPNTVNARLAGAESGCLCITSNNTTEVVNFSEAECVLVSTSHPTRPDVSLRGCAWSTPTDRESALNILDTLADEIIDTQNRTADSNRPNTQQIRTSLESLNKLSAPSVQVLIGTGLRLFTGVFGSIALVMIIYGGVQIMTAAGQSDKIKQGSKIIVWASIGLITMMLSNLLVTFVLRAIA
jgi:hypothetical protein